jgi:hypothetical protein
MPKRSAKRAVRVPKAVDPADRLEKALAKRTKGELVEALVEIASTERRIMRQIESQFEVEPPADELVAATREAIADATDFDERDINQNFDYNYDAYGVVHRNFERLIEMGYLGTAMELSLELMRQGSYQVEMSDEGLMTDDIEECLRVVIGGIKVADLPADEVADWCKKMAAKDRMKFICRKELLALRE